MLHLAERPRCATGARHALKRRSGGTVRASPCARWKSPPPASRAGRRNEQGQDERPFLEPLIEFAQANETPAERKLALYHGEWGGDIDRVFREFAY